MAQSNETPRVSEPMQQEKLGPLRVRMSVLQQRARTLGIPAVVVVEGMSAAGKGDAISGLIESLDPRGFNVYAMRAPNEQEKRFPWLHRYHQRTPAKGRIAIFDGSWYDEMFAAQFNDDMGDAERQIKRNQTCDMEGKLATSGAVVIKLFLLISQKEQKKRLKKLEGDKHTRWRVSKIDWLQNKHYERAHDIYTEMMEHTSHPFAPWHVILSEDRKSTIRSIYHIMIDAFEQAITQKEALAQSGAAPEYGFVPYVKPIQTAPIQLLGDVDLNKTLEDDTQYKPQLKQAQQRLKDLHNRIYQAKIPVVLGFEGWDAAGKGGSILRLTQALDPRGFQVNPTSAPDATELAHHYLWRFWNHVPKNGHIAIFDRTWYGRVMVERVEKLTAEGDWRRAYDEINQFEHNLADWGAIVIKFWLQIDQEEQLRRFHDRQNTPEKQYKITDEDWRNREKWPLYETAVNEMLQKTSTSFAPWVIVESNNKHYGRLKVLNTVIDAIEARLK
ncbi:polyphosphate:AMP phosphotransferase [Eubacteriales bacterium OttesenSCG-928-N13]|nr:polyphosphate:AMP phosphotransferase [Eubacteriales bacterium OttesenSCG-928-N13]